MIEEERVVKTPVTKQPQPVVTKPPPPFPQRLARQKEEATYKKFLDLLKQVHVNVPLVDMLQGIPKYAKYIKDIVANKSRFTEYATVALTEECTSRIQNRLPTKLKDPGSFTIEISIGKQVVARALCDLGASINLMPSSIFRKLGLGVLRPTTIVLQLADRSLARPEGIIEDVLVQISDIQGISPALCMHKILMEDDHKPSAQHQRRLNPVMKEVVKKEVIKWLDSGIIFLPFRTKKWVSPVQCVPKKGGMTVVTNDKNELIPTRTITGWRICMDYRKLNEATRKDHYPIPFIDQMLDRLAGQEFYCFLDGYSGYNQIAIAPEDQEKTTFTCPYGTYAFKRMPFGLCNAPATFQRCMMAIFSEMVEDFVEVFMDDFSVFGNSFEVC
ncbi:uncharacterized protein LOC132031986 [Lycium ferocissimum]|uniref:uncharacterized protein LOC132031986 n=1 Tax=Lycium ferocissimum TaxID=112874 RepID=UPI0028160D89|nr:uncharacterized protein LOC132031986 [Lycium ferocissimum]